MQVQRGSFGARFLRAHPTSRFGLLACSVSVERAVDPVRARAEGVL